MTAKQDILVQFILEAGLVLVTATCLLYSTATLAGDSPEYVRTIEKPEQIDVFLTETAPLTDTEVEPYESCWTKPSENNKYTYCKVKAD